MARAPGYCFSCWCNTGADAGNRTRACCLASSHAATTSHLRNCSVVGGAKLNSPPHLTMNSSAGCRLRRAALFADGLSRSPDLIHRRPAYLVTSPLAVILLWPRGGRCISSSGPAGGKLRCPTPQSFSRIMTNRNYFCLSPANLFPSRKKPTNLRRRVGFGNLLACFTHPSFHCPTAKYGAMAHNHNDSASLLTCFQISPSASF